MPPIRSPRRLYLIPQITVRTPRVGETGEGADGIEGTADDERPIIVKMKEAIGDFFSLTPIATNDPIFNGTFGGSGTNEGFRYRRRLGGFRQASYTCIANTQFTLNETFEDDNGDLISQSATFKTFTFGLPKGHSVSEVIDFLISTGTLDQMRALRTPAGTEVDLFIPS